jgi:Sec-independent protein translocase protein TatA
MGKGIREFKKNINEATREVTTDTKAPLDSDSQSRLTAAELERRRTAEEAERPEPKRLL